MAGNRHHYLPVFLMKGFASRRSRKGVYTFCFRRDTGSGNIELAELNVVNVGVERNFYGSEGESELDRLQTDREAHFARAVADARNNGVVDSELIAEFAANIGFRTRSLRDGFLSMARRILEAGRTATCQNVEKVVTDVMVRRAFDSVARKRGLDRFEQLPPETQKLMLDGFRPFLAEFDSAIQPLARHLHGTVDSVWDEMSAGVTYEAVRQGHIASLERTVVPPKAVEYMRSLDWSVTKFQPGTLILGDVGVIAYVAATDTFELSLEAPKRDASVLLPVSDQCALVGANKAAATPPVVPRFINEASACLSWSFIVSSRNTANEQALSRLIGSRADSSWDEGVKAGEDRIVEWVLPWRRTES